MNLAAASTRQSIPVHLIQSSHHSLNVCSKLFRRYQTRVELLGWVQIPQWVGGGQIEILGGCVNCLMNIERVKSQLVTGQTRQGTPSDAHSQQHTCLFSGSPTVSNALPSTLNAPSAPGWLVLSGWTRIAIWRYDFFMSTWWCTAVLHGVGERRRVRNINNNARYQIISV